MNICFLNKVLEVELAILIEDNLPINSFKWVKNIDQIEEKLMKTNSNSSTGNILEVDLEYPKELHDIHNDYRLEPQKINIKKRMVIWLLFRNWIWT